VLPPPGKKAHPRWPRAAGQGRTSRIAGDGGAALSVSADGVRQPPRGAKFETDDSLRAAADQEQALAAAARVEGAGEDAAMTKETPETPAGPLGVQAGGLIITPRCSTCRFQIPGVLHHDLPPRPRWKATFRARCCRRNEARLTPGLPMNDKGPARIDRRGHGPK